MGAELADFIFVDTAVGGVAHRNHVKRVSEVVVNGTNPSVRASLGSGTVRVSGSITLARIHPYS